MSAPRTRAGARKAAAGARARATATANNGSVNRDALLRAVFPAGLPAREAVIRAATEWLEDAERIARMR